MVKLQLTSLNDIAVLGAGLALLVVWQTRRVLRHGGSFYDREIYGMTPVVHRRIGGTAAVVALLCIGLSAFPSIPVTPFVAVETVAVILYLASFARGASHEDEVS